MTGFMRRLRARLRNRRFDADLAEELRFHEEMTRGELQAQACQPTRRVRRRGGRWGTSR